MRLAKRHASTATPNRSRADMSDLISTAPVPAGTAPDDPSVEPVIRGDGWYPSVDMRDARTVLRLLDGTITDARLRDALIEGIAHTRDVLAEWRELREREGAADLAATLSGEVDGVSVQVSRFRRAVYAWALAWLVERYRGYDTSSNGARRAEALDCLPDDARRDAYWAMSDIMRRRRVTVDLI
ncbi:head completion/stabilization protein [Burkholderia aenigmatica]|uniref:head completion/stabilization protein n=1 Tax=Burkholderia aenigmatica TaxID=2015348 RepID=UPI001F2A1E1A|nr:head completion/stabilization protein [Burkholderia aenigmatica]UKD15452.1 head completion/stabilization protein [Burkholderia aenigmatica]